MKILITGGAGFIGSHTAAYLASKGYEVIVADDMRRASSLGLHLLKHSIVDIVRVDIRDTSKLIELIERADVVVHAAALVNAAESVEKPAEYTSVNVEGTVSVLHFAVRRGVYRFILLSSAAVYGEPIYIPVNESHPLKPINPYGASKAAAEIFVETYWRLYKLPYVILRLFNVYGPGQSRGYAGLIAKTIERVARGEPPVIYGDGLQTRDFIYVCDVVEAIRLAIETNAVNEVYNIGSGREYRVIDVVKMILELMGKQDIQPIYKPPRPGDIRRSYASIEKARRLLGFEPKYSLRRGLEETIAVMMGARPRSSALCS